MSANQNDYRSAQLSAAAELRITFPATELGERFKQTVRDASVEQMQSGDRWQRDGDGDDRGRWLETRDGAHFAPDDRDLTGAMGLFIGGGVFSFAAVMLLLVYLSEREVLLAVGAGVAALLGVSLLNAGRLHYPRAKRSPRFSGMYLLDRPPSTPWRWRDAG